jgi:hypothetical protein
MANLIVMMFLGAYMTNKKDYFFFHPAGVGFVEIS